MAESTGLTCMVCKKPQEEDEGGEIREKYSRQFYICSQCLPAWRASELFCTPSFSHGALQGLSSTQSALLDRLTNFEKRLGDIRKNNRFVDSQLGGQEKADHPNFDLSAAAIKTELDRWVVGQEAAKIEISTIAHRHYMGVKQRVSGENNSSIKRQVVMLVGPTGCGKSLIARKLGDILGVPYIIPSTAHFTEEGYHGNSVNEAIQMLCMKSGGNGSEEWGIVCWDEIDKKAMRDVGGRRDISGLGVQQALLDHLDSNGMEIDISGGKNDPRLFDNSNVFTVLAGAFSEDIRGKMQKQRSKGRTIGFGVYGEKEREGTHVRSDDDIQDYGFIPEFCSRIGHIIVLDHLTKDDMKSILLDVEDAPVPVAIALARQYGFTLRFSDSAIEKIVEKAVQSGRGARKLRHIVEAVTLRVFYEAPERMAKRKSRLRVTITGDTVDDPSKYSVS